MMKRMNVYLDDELWWAFRKQCFDRRISASQALTALLRQALADTPADPSSSPGETQDSPPPP